MVPKQDVGLGRAVEREEEAAVLEAEAAAAELEKAEEAKNAPVQLDASHFEAEDEQAPTTDAEAVVETVETVALEASSETTEAAPASV